MISTQPLVRAAEYVRMSTEAQRYSVANQQAAIREYAAQRGLVVVRTYADEGKSGLTIRARAALGQLLQDVVGGRADYEVILVYDVSRWGRFQDTDESAHYEYLCRKADVRVEYCAETFGNDCQPLNMLLKSLKRSMAAEYSRELSERLSRAKRRVASLGYFVGGNPGYGLRRVVVAQDGTRKTLLERGQFKAIASDRIILTPGPALEVEIVRWIFKVVADGDRTPSEIAWMLNREGHVNSYGRSWRGAFICKMINNDRYLGTYVYNKETEKLAGRRVANSESQWIKVPNAIEPIVSVKVATAARAALEKRRPHRYTREELQSHLRHLLKKRGHLSHAIVKNCQIGPQFHIYRQRYGGLRAAFADIGYKPPSGIFDRAVLKQGLRLRRLIGTITEGLGKKLAKLHAGVTYNRRQQLIAVGNRLSVTVSPAKYVETRGRKNTYWVVETTRETRSDLTVLVRMDKDNRRVLDYWLLPADVIRRGWMALARHEFNVLTRCRWSTQEELVRALRRKLAPNS